MIWTVMTFRSIPTYTYICVPDHITLGCSSLQGLQSWTQSVSAFTLLFSPFRRTAPSNLEIFMFFFALFCSLVRVVRLVLVSFSFLSFCPCNVTSAQHALHALHCLSLSFATLFFHVRFVLLSTGDPFIFLVILAAFILLSLHFIHVFPLRPPTLLFKRAKKNQVGWRDYTVVWEAYCSIASIVDLLKWQNEYIASSVTSCIKHSCIGPMSKTYTCSVTSTSSVTGITLNIKPAVPVCTPNYIT